MGEGIRTTLGLLVAVAVCLGFFPACTTTATLDPGPFPVTTRDGDPAEVTVSTESPQTFAVQEFDDLEIEDRPYEGTVIEDAAGNLVKFYYVRPGRGTMLTEALKRFTGIEAIEHKADWGEKAGEGGYEIVLVTGTEDDFSLVDERLDQIEAQIPMVEIEAKVVELVQDDDFQLGVQTLISDIGKNGGDNDETLFKSFQGIFDTQDFKTAELLGTNFQGGILELATHQDEIALDFVIQALEKNRLANVLSAPTITVLDGFKASITVGDEVPIQTFKSIAGTALVDVTFKEAAIKLEVTPYIVGKDSIRLDVKPEVSRVTAFTDPGNRGLSNPIISTRNAQTTVLVRSGYTFVIGGLIGNSEIEEVRKTPILGDIPIIKHLFRTTQRQKVDTNVIFLIQPKIRYPVFYGKASERIIEPDLDSE